MCDVITWRHSVKRWSYSLGNDSIEFLDLKNLENDTNKVAVRLLQPEIQYMTLWRHVWRHHVTSKCSSADRTVLEMIPLNFLTSKTYKITPKTFLYDFYSLVNKWGTLVPPVGLNRQIFYLGFSKVNSRQFREGTLKDWQMGERRGKVRTVFLKERKSLRSGCLLIIGRRLLTNLLNFQFKISYFEPQFTYIFNIPYNLWWPEWYIRI